MGRRRGGGLEWKTETRSEQQEEEQEDEGLDGPELTPNCKRRKSKSASPDESAGL